MCGMLASELLAHGDVPAKRFPPANAAASFQRLNLHVCEAKHAGMAKKRKRTPKSVLSCPISNSPSQPS
jgi:hypothetical protein